jgi:hypothetical protein
LPPSAALAFKAQEIEELADVYFFRPVGMVFARGAQALRLSPTAVTLAGTAVGVLGGVMLYEPRLALPAFVLIVLHGVLDSSDGQLARMTGRTSELGRVLDGAAGYVTHVAIYLAIGAGALMHGASPSIWLLAIGAGVANVIHAQLYDYHRSAYAAAAIKGVVEGSVGTGHPAGDIVLRTYEAAQRWLAGPHQQVERALAARSADGCVRTGDRALYRECFYWPVRGWNVMGDNTRFYVVGILALAGRLEWFFLWQLVPMNVLLAGLWLWQSRADRRFLARL